MKKGIVILLAMLFVTVLSACASPKEAAAVETKPPETKIETKAAETKAVPLKETPVQKNSNDKNQKESSTSSKKNAPTVESQTKTESESTDETVSVPNPAWEGTFHGNGDILTLEPIDGNTSEFRFSNAGYVGAAMINENTAFHDNGDNFQITFTLEQNTLTVVTTGENTEITAVLDGTYTRE